MSESSPLSLPPSSGGGAKFPILFGAVLALVGATVYGYYQINQLRAELTETRDLLAQEIAQVNETSTVSTQTSKRTSDTLKEQLVEARRQAAELAGQAKIEATRHADDLAYKLEQLQAKEDAKLAASINGVSEQVNVVKESTSANQNRVAEVSTEVAAVKSQAQATQSELEKTVAALKSTQGDLGVQSGLIATNSKELSALRALGDRNYTEFEISKAKTSTRVGDLMVRLTKTDPKKNRYTIEVIVDDKKVEKKDKTVNEPVQFAMPKARYPYELVVNEVKKDTIAGYLSAPKVQQARN